MIRIPSKPPYDVMRPRAALPTLGAGTAAGTLSGVDNSSKIENELIGAIKGTRDALPEAIREAETRFGRKEVSEALTRMLDQTTSELRDVEGDFQLAEARLIMAEFADWQNNGLRLEKRTSSSLHHLLDALRAKEVRLPFFELTIPGTAASLDDIRTWDISEGDGDQIQSFVIQHDWASAFAKAVDFAGADLKLPFPSVCFEFRISGKNVCALVNEEADDSKILAICVEGKRGWAVPQHMYRKIADGPWLAPEGKPDRFELIKDLIIGQIRAICISLDAEVSTTELIRAPLKLNRSRQKRGRTALADFHIVRLAHRHRALPLPDKAAEPGTRKRLHFRRGHWRHFNNHKTWIRWTLVGDPDLGFIDKHYRL
jgi:hypothetical protein